MTEKLTAPQEIALPFYADPQGIAPRGVKRPAVATYRSLCGMELIESRQATDAEKRAIGRPIDLPWRVTVLTGRGRLLLGQITEAKADAPATDADPFAAFDKFNDFSEGT